MRRNWWFAVAGSLTAVTLAASLAWSAPSEAAIPTSNMTVILNGREVVVGVDPISLKAGLLIPAAIAEETGVRVVESNGAVTLSREGVAVRMKIGSKNATKGDESFLLPTSPMIVSGEIFIPEEALSHVGVQASSEGGMLLVDVWPAAKASGTSASEYNTKMLSLVQRHTVNPSRDSSLRIDVAQVDREIALTQAWSPDPFVRGRAIELLNDNFLVHVVIVNQSTKMASLPVGNYFLVDDMGNQYTPSAESLPVNGDPFGSLGPSSTAVGVLIFPKPRSEATVVSLYLQTSSSVDRVGYFLP